MRFLVDECTGPGVAQWLIERGHDVFSVFDEARGADDKIDKDFGEMVFRDRRPHCGIILLRLDDQRMANKIVVISSILQNYADELPNAFVVASDHHIRFASA